MMNQDEIAEKLAFAANFQASAFSTHTENQPYNTISVLDWIVATTGQEAREVIEPVRPLDKETRKRKKLSFPCFTPSVVLSTKAKEVPMENKLKSYNGVFCGDLDNIPPADQAGYIEILSQIPGVFFIAQSFSGQGLYFFTVTDNTDWRRHGLYFDALSEAVEEATGKALDPLTKDVGRLRALSYDSDPFVNPEPGVFTLPDGFEESRNKSEIIDETEPLEFLGGSNANKVLAVEDCLKQWEEKKVVLGSDTYYLRYALGTALKWIGEQGFSFYQRICAGYTHPRTPRQEWDGFPAPKQDGAKRITLGSFFYLMRETWGIIPRDSGPRLTTEGLPIEFQRVVDSLCASFQVPMQIPLACVLGATAAAVGARATLIERDYLNHPQLYIAICAPAGTGKSEPLSWCFRPLRNYDAFLARESAAALAEWEKTEKKGPRPVTRSILADDATPEALTQALADNPDGLCLASGELSSALNVVTTRYSGGGNSTNILLRAFNNEAISSTRKVGGKATVQHPVLSICGAIQPDYLNQVFGDPALQGNGFLERFLVFWVVNMKPRRYNDGQAIPEDVATFWQGFIDHCLRLPATEYRLSQDARDEYAAAYDKTEVEVSKIPADDKRRAIVAKLQIAVLRLALIFQIMQDYITPDGDFPNDEIGLAAMKSAIGTLPYFARTAEKAQNAIKKGRGARQKMTKGEAIRQLYKAFDGNLNQAKLAAALGMDASNVNREIHKNTIG